MEKARVTEAWGASRPPATGRGSPRLRGAEWGGLQFEVDIDVGERHWVCRVIGELDSFTAPQLHDALGTVPATSALIIDLSEVPFIDSAGLRALVARIRWIRQAGGDSVVCSSRPTVNRALQLTGFDRFVPVAPTEEEAAEILAHNQAQL